MINMLQDVEDFQRKFDLDYGGKPRCLPMDLAQFRVRFMEEELTEYRTANNSLQFDMGKRVLKDSDVTKGLEDMLDALVDLTYVVLGTAVMQFPPGVFEEAWRRVHAKNMEKVRVDPANVHLYPRRSVHDVVKPNFWTPPDHSDLVADHAHGEATVDGKKV